MRIVASASLVLALVAADAADAAPRPRLKAFSSCKHARRATRATARSARDGGVGVVGRAVAGRRSTITTPPIAPLPPTMAPRPAASPAAAGAGLGAEGRGGEAVPEFSGTNTQETDVDEPDVIKTDGRRIFAVTDRTLRVIDAASGAVTGTLALDGFDHRLLLRGDRVLAIATKGASADGEPSAGRSRPTVAPLAEHDDRDRDRRLGRAEGACARWRSRAASSTRARTAPSRGW